ncbi:MAG: asparagine synthase [Bacillota bacterium]|nr:MAG: asparagine synthase [Bacillota bacterium]
MGLIGLTTGEQAEEKLEALVAKMAHRAGGRQVRSLAVDAGPAGFDAWTAGRGALDRPGGRVAIGGTECPGPVPDLKTLLSFPDAAAISLPDRPPRFFVCDGSLPDSFALAAAWEDGSVVLARGPLGLRPLYYLDLDSPDRGGGRRPVAFASTIKALAEQAGGEGRIRTFPPGHLYAGCRFHRFTRVRDWPRLPVPAGDPAGAASALRDLVGDAVERGCQAGASLEDGRDDRVRVEPPAGLFLSGGIDSSVVAAAAVERLGAADLRSFSVGTLDSEDLPKARLVAERLGLRHTERVIDEDDVVRVLPRVIEHLESMDAPLVRSSVANYVVAGMAAEAGCGQALCGEGGDELFAGYAYLKDFDSEKAVDAELLALLEGGHSNGFQRVDRMTSAHGLEARVPLSAPALLAFALRVPLDWKIHSGQEKWILRQAYAQDLPDDVVERPKAKFYEGSGMEGLMSRVAYRLVSDADFRRWRGKEVAPGHPLNTKEEILYYRLFREHIPHPSALETIGWTRTLGAAS